VANFSFARWASSATHLFGGSVTSLKLDLLHSPAFRATPLDMKAEADRFFLEGVNQLIDMDGPIRARSYGPDGGFMPQQPLAITTLVIVIADVTRYLQRISYLLRQGKPANELRYCCRMTMPIPSSHR